MKNKNSNTINTYSEKSIKITNDSVTFNKNYILGILIFILGLTISCFFSYKLYYFLNPYNNNKLMTYNMLTAIKNIDISFVDMFKKKSVLRIIQFVLLIIFLKSNLRILFFYIISMCSGIYLGFNLIIFYLEMGIEGILNLFIVFFPHTIFYLASYLCVINLLIFKKKPQTSYIYYTNILCLWFIGILSELIINLLLVQKVFIIN